jgi:hypothetical protein
MRHQIWHECIAPTPLGRSLRPEHYRIFLHQTDPRTWPADMAPLRVYACLDVD